MYRLERAEYKQELDAVGQSIAGECLEALRNKTLVISGATGMIGAYLIDLLLRMNTFQALGCRIVALGRSAHKAVERLPYFGRDDFTFVEADVCAPGFAVQCSADYVLHLASSTHPLQYSMNPIGTIEANVQGTKNLLELAAAQDARFLFASSVEIYGEGRGDVERFDEAYCGYIDCNTLRACYTESKRLGESMCQAYRAQKGVDFVTARIARVYGPTLLPDDSKALSQFLHKAQAGENIILKSTGTQQFSYLYVADVVTGLLTILAKGQCGEAYNLADDAVVTLGQLAELVADAAGVEVEYDIPDAQEAAGYSKATKALMDASKAKRIGWLPSVEMGAGIEQTLRAIAKSNV